MRRATVVTTLVIAGLLTSACDYRGAASLPLPGGVGGGGYEVTMVFDDVTNLVPKETCRSNDVVIGSVVSIELRDDLRAEVVCRIASDIELAGNAVATLRETSLLGERFVALDPPAGVAPVGRIEPGATLDQADSHVVPDVEVVLGALSQVLNGGGLQHIETISRELSLALGEADLGGTTRQLAGLVGTLDDHRDDIVDALESVDRLAEVLSDQRDVIAEALDSVPQGLAVLDRQRPRLVRTLTALGDLSEVALPLIRRSKDDTVSDLLHLAPVLEQLAASKHHLARALESILTFPFPSYTKYVSQGDYAGMFATLNFDIDSFNQLLAQSPGAPVAQPPTGPDGPGPPSPAIPAIPAIPALPDLSVDDLIELLPDLPVPDGAPLGLGGPGGTSRSSAPPRTLAELLVGGAS